MYLSIQTQTIVTIHNTTALNPGRVSQKHSFKAKHFRYIQQLWLFFVHLGTNKN